MVNVTIENGKAIFDVEGLHQLWALRSHLEVPLTHITDVEHDPELVGRWWHGWRVFGTEVPGILAAGTFYYHGELVFWDVNDPGQTIIVSLNHERYKKLIVEVADPEAVGNQLRAALRQKS